MGTRLDFEFYAKKHISVRTTSKILRIPEVYGVISLTSGNVIQGGSHNQGPLRSLIVCTVQVYVRNDANTFQITDHVKNCLKRYLSSEHGIPVIEVMHCLV